MMKKIYLICMTALLLVAAGCTQNNGRIGHWFGQWKVERVVVDGVDDPDYEGNAFLLPVESVWRKSFSSGRVFRKHVLWALGRARRQCALRAVQHGRKLCPVEQPASVFAGRKFLSHRFCRRQMESVGNDIARRADLHLLSSVVVAGGCK